MNQRRSKYVNWVEKMLWFNCAHAFVSNTFFGIYFQKVYMFLKSITFIFWDKTILLALMMLQPEGTVCLCVLITQQKFCPTQSLLFLSSDFCQKLVKALFWRTMCPAKWRRGCRMRFKQKSFAQSKILKIYNKNVPTKDNVLSKDAFLLHHH